MSLSLWGRSFGMNRLVVLLVAAAGVTSATEVRHIQHLKFPENRLKLVLLTTFKWLVAFLRLHIRKALIQAKLLHAAVVMKVPFQM